MLSLTEIQDKIKSIPLIETEVITETVLPDEIKLVSIVSPSTYPVYRVIINNVKKPAQNWSLTQDIINYYFNFRGKLFRIEDSINLLHHEVILSKLSNIPKITIEILCESFKQDCFSIAVDMFSDSNPVTTIKHNDVIVDSRFMANIAKDYIQYRDAVISAKKSKTKISKTEPKQYRHPLLQNLMDNSKGPEPKHDNSQFRSAVKEHKNQIKSYSEKIKRLELEKNDASIEMKTKEDEMYAAINKFKQARDTYDRNRYYLNSITQAKNDWVDLWKSRIYTLEDFL